MGYPYMAPQGFNPMQYYMSGESGSGVLSTLDVQAAG